MKRRRRRRSFRQVLSFTRKISLNKGRHHFVHWRKDLRLRLRKKRRRRKRRRKRRSFREVLSIDRHCHRQPLITHHVVIVVVIVIITHHVVIVVFVIIICSIQSLSFTCSNCSCGTRTAKSSWPCFVFESFQGWQQGQGQEKCLPQSLFARNKEKLGRTRGARANVAR